MLEEATTKGSRRIAGPRLIALAGPFQSGKTTLLDAILARSGALERQGSVRDGTSVGDASLEARQHAMSVSANIASADYLGDRFTFVDLPGSVEFSYEMRNVLPLCDAVVVVCEADPRKLPALQLILRELEELAIPRLVFLNKVDLASSSLREALQILQPASRVPLLLRQIPLWQNGVVTGFIDLALERAYVYREHAPSTVIDLPPGGAVAEKDEARYSMLEKLADYDDALMEELIGDIEPPRDQIFDDLAREMREGHSVPLLIGSADRGNGVTRLLKVLRHEAPGIDATTRRLGIAEDGPPLARALRTVHTAHGGKLTLARVLRGHFTDGATIAGPRGEDRIGGLSRLMGMTASKQARAERGDTLAFGRLDHVATGECFVESRGADAKLGAAPNSTIVAPPAPVHAFAISVKDRKDEVRLTAAIAKLIDEDPSLVFQQDQQSGEMKLMGQGEMHLRVALERLAARFGVVVELAQPGVAYRETIRDSVHVRGRHKKQSGGHGQYGDVLIDVGPLPRGQGFQFAENVHGGTVPKQYFTSVEAGCRDACLRGPLGFPVVDVSATLVDGSYHVVDSSDMAFRLAAKAGMIEALAKARPVLLEPILAVDIMVPSDALARASALIAARRGQILGYEGREGWQEWDVLHGLIPESEMADLIVELRSATSGVGTYGARFDHLAEMAGRPAELAAARGREAAH